jgi:hypothetical protein
MRAVRHGDRKAFNPEYPTRRKNVGRDADVAGRTTGFQAGAFVAGYCPEGFFNKFPESFADSSKKALAI